MNNKGILILLVVVPVFIGFIIGKKMKEHKEVQIKQQVVASQTPMVKPAMPNQVNHSVLAPNTDNLKPPEDVKQQNTTMQDVNKQNTNNNKQDTNKDATNNSNNDNNKEKNKEKIDTGTSTINENKDANKGTADNKCECKEEDKKRVIRKAVDEEIKKVKEKEKRKEKKEENKENKEKENNDQVVLSNIKSMSVVCKLNQDCYLTDGVKQYRKGDKIGDYTIDSIGILGVDLTGKKGNKVRVSL